MNNRYKMSTRALKLEKDLCRCCHSEGAFKSLYSPYFWVNNEEVVYFDILRKYFDIELTPVTKPSNHMGSICDACIQRLLDAVEFKHQVQKCERRFRDVYLGHTDSALKVDVKEELHDGEEPICKVEIKDEFQELDNNVRKDITGSQNSTIKNSLISSREVGAGTDDYEDEMDFKWSDKEDIPGEAGKETNDRKTKVVSVKRKEKNKNGHPKKNNDSPKDEKIETGTVKDDDQSGLRLKEGVDFKRVGDAYLCCTCQTKRKNRNTLRKHIRNVHLKSERLKCPNCPKKFDNLSSLVKHKLEEHNIDDRHKCNACEKVFSSKQCLNIHMRSFHMLGEKYKCNKCDYDTFNGLAFYRHKFKHKIEKDFHCTYCSKSFKRKNTLKFHERIHTGDKRKVCKVCEQTFVQKASLNYHMTKYHPGVDY